ncbi:MAG TPA: hypothetical protein VNW99_02520 [Cytophagaceae bacterium]|jgi:hypothetical protein|nr:hypothetical protein [Cytophagaceae bacterium]
MRVIIFFIVVFVCAEARAQLRINASVVSPPFLENNSIGKSQQFSSVKNSLSAGVEFDHLFPKEKAGAKLHYSAGFYYSSPAYIGVFQDSNGNQFLSEINSQVINMPIMARGSFPISDLIENNRMGIELGIVTTTWIKYKLQEVASIKTKDVNGNIIGETIYSDEGSLIKGFGSKFNFKAVAGFFVYVNRFYLSARFDLISLSDLYSNRLNSTWQVPSDYSLYQRARKEGRMKDSFCSLILSFRLTKK